MAPVDNYLWPIVVTILSLIMHSLGGTIEGISRSTAMSLILLKHYQEQVAIHGKRAEEIHRLQFIDKWKYLVQDHDIMLEILNYMEKDWMYTLHLASKSKHISMNLMVTSHSEHWPEQVNVYITDLIVTLYAKLLAMYHAMLYLEGIFYYTLVPPRPTLYDCKNMAIHLLVFFQQGTDELLQSMIQVFDIFSPTDELNIIKDIAECLKKTKNFHLNTRHFITEVESLIRSNLIGIQQIEMITKNWYHNARLLTNFICQQQEYFLLKFTLRALEDSVQDESTAGPIQNFNEMKLFWCKAGNISKYFLDSNEDVEYTMADVIRASLIKRTEINNVCRRNIIEKFEIMIPDKFKTFINNNLISNNANLNNE